MKIETFRDLYNAELSEAASFEAQLAEEMPKLAALASAPSLRDALSSHAEGPSQQESGLERILLNHGCPPHQHLDQSMQAMIAESRKMADMVPAGPLRDAAIIASVQRLKHYEVAVYGTLATYAECLGLEDEKEMLGGILDQEKAFDQSLSRIAKDVVNPQAAA